MAIRIALNDTNHLFNLTIDQAYNYGLEDDRQVELGGDDTIYSGAGNDYLEGAGAPTSITMATATTRFSADQAAITSRSTPEMTSIMGREAPTLCRSIRFTLGSKEPTRWPIRGSGSTCP